jgi:DNA helicase II / ATP-dependent DNA helicase PcrA
LGLDSWSNVLELRRVAANYTVTPMPVALELFLENVALVGGTDTVQTGENGTLAQENKCDAITLITLHAAKGLEYPVVFIIGLDEGSLPHAHAREQPERLEEERRLAYVGFTRAMLRLYLVRASRRSLFGQYQVTEPSRFLDDVPRGLMVPFSGETSGLLGGRYTNLSGEEKEPPLPVGSVAQTSATRGLRVNEVETPVPSRDTGEGQEIQPGEVEISSQNLKRWPPDALSQARKPFKAGIKVRHSKFGEGVVLKSEIVDGTEFVEVHFRAGIGKRRLSMDFERLSRV